MGKGLTLQFGRHLDRPLVTLAVVAILYFVFLAAYLQRHDAAFFVQAGDYFVDTTKAPDNLFTVTPSTGYDGTFYYRLAITPFTREQTAFGITLDNPRYRHQRILYPLLAWFFSFRSPPLAIYSLIVVNFLGLCTLGRVGAHYAQEVNRHALFGAFFAIYPGFLYTLTRNLSEIVEALFVLAALVALRQQRGMLAVTLLVLAILAKETAVLLPAAVLLVTTVAYWQKKATGNWWVGLIPLLVFSLWQIGLTLWWQDTLIKSAQLNIGLPFWGITRGFQISAAIGGSPAKWVIEASALFILAVAAFFSLHNSTATRLEQFSWYLYLVLLLMLSGQVWLEGQAFLRAGSLFYLFSVAIFLNTRNQFSTILPIIALAAWVVMANYLLL